MKQTAIMSACFTAREVDLLLRGKSGMGPKENYALLFR